MAASALPIANLPSVAAPNRGALRVVQSGPLEAALTAEAVRKAAAEKAAKQGSDTAMTDLAAYVRTQFEHFSNHRNNTQSGWSHRLLAAMRTFNGQYPPEKLRDIKAFGGSEVYARIVAMKCRGASSLLRDVYLSPDRPWGLAPPADPDIPEEIVEHIKRLVMIELDTLQKAGAQIDPSMIRARVMALSEAAKLAEKKQAAKRAELAEDRIEELLVSGGFYRALGELIADVPLFPYGVMKGPVVRIVPKVVWNNGVAVTTQKPQMFWDRVSPFDVYWTPGASDIETADFIERGRITRAELNDLLDLPGYDHDAVRAVLDEYGRGGLVDNWDSTDSERAVQENRENPQFNRSGLLNQLEFNGNIQGRLLNQWKVGGNMVEDELRDYKVQLWLIGRHVIKVQLSPSPRKRHPYYITSFEKVPGTPVGNGLPDILADIEDVCNATLRALVNNMSISSGPQVVVNVDRLAPGEDAESLHPWKRWYVNSDPVGSNQQDPISFFSPQSNAQELLVIYEKFNAMADDLSAIPKYMAGAGAGAGAGRTAAGLAMLMGNASKILQTVAANIDGDVISPLLLGLFDMLMLTDTTGLLHGNESIEVKGVNVALQRETQRARQLEFLQITANPIDAPIMGTKGRATLLRTVSATLGMDGETIIPTDEELAAAAAAPGPAAPEEAGAEAQGTQQGGGVNGDMGPRVNITGGAG